MDATANNPDLAKRLLEIAHTIDMPAEAVRDLEIAAKRLIRLDEFVSSFDVP